MGRGAKAAHPNAPPLLTGLADELVKPASVVIDLEQRRLGEHVEVRDLAEYEVAAPVTEATSYQRLREHLAYLGLTTAEHLSVELDQALTEQLSAAQVLERLLELEHDATQARRLRGRLRFVRYPVHKRLADFDFDFQPTWTGSCR